MPNEKNPNEPHTFYLRNRLTGANQLGDGCTLKAIGLWPFWGSAIALHHKKNETRSWYRGFTGPLAIYQTKGINRGAIEAYEDLKKATGEPKPFNIPHPKVCPLQCVVAIARVVGAVACPHYESGMRYRVIFYNGDGTEEDRVIPPVDPPETLLGDYATTEEMTRYAWILTDVYSLPTPIVVPTNDRENRQGIFDLPAAVALPALQQYRKYLIDLRPKCRCCGQPFGVNGITEDGESLWKETVNGWQHICPRMSANLTGLQALEDARLARAFSFGDFPIVPFSEEDAARMMQRPTIAKTLSLFD